MIGLRGSLQNAWSRLLRWLRGPSLLLFFDRNRRESVVNRSWALPNAVFFGLVLLTFLCPLVSPRTRPPSELQCADAGKFSDVTSALGVNFQYLASHTSKKYLLETMGSGVALFDYDNDGRLDLFLINAAPLTDSMPTDAIPQKTGPAYWNRLYHQKSDGTFEDVTEKAGLQGVGYGMGVAVGDYDNDGYEDLYVTAYGGNRLYHNNGNGTFSDVTEKAGVAAVAGLPARPGSIWITTACWI